MHDFKLLEEHSWMKIETNQMRTAQQLENVR